MLRDERKAAPETTTRAEDEARPPRLLVCAECGRRTTSTAARTEVAGSHEHTKANPHGVLFRIGCFTDAVGVRTRGGAFAEWSWFAGYVWTMEDCAGCRTHLGWLFQSGAHAFHGLVLDRLVEMDE